MVGPFPPPIFGSAVITAALRDALVSAGIRVVEIDSSGESLVQGSLFARVSRRLRVAARVAACLRQEGPRASLYISFAGGGGQFGDFLNVLSARILRRPISFHHHSFAYIRTARAVPRCVFALAGKGARHIFLCQAMRRQAMQHYASVRRGYVLSNAGLIGFSAARHEARPLGRVGFLSNLDITKGGDRFVELARLARAEGLTLGFDVAGPYRDDVSRKLVEAAVQEGLIAYHGGLSGDAKQAFLETIDVLVLPSRYPHEAEPLVILEALSAGIPVIATKRGCIADLLDAPHGLLLDQNADDLDPAVSQLARWIAEPEVFLAARRHALSHILALKTASGRTLPRLLRHIAWQSDIGRH